PARMLPWAAKPGPVRPPAQAKHAPPVCDADPPWASTTPAWRWLRSGSAFTRRSSTWPADMPLARRARPPGPYVTFAYDCVAIAPTPACGHGTAAPTARNFDWTATPRSPVAGSSATMEYVMRRGYPRGGDRPHRGPSVPERTSMVRLRNQPAAS